MSRPRGLTIRILVHSIFYRPELTGVAKYTAELCEWLATKGHEVHVVAPPPYYPQWRVHDGYRQGRYSRESLGGVSVHRAPIWIPKRPGGVGRILYALSFAISSIFPIARLASRRPDWIIVIEPSFLNSIAALIASRLSGARAWLHIQDFEIDLAYDLGQLRRGRKIVESVETWILKQFDAVSSITPRLVEKARKKGVVPERLHLVPNWFNPEVIHALVSNPLRQTFGFSEQTVIALFAGSLGAKQGVEILIDATRLLSGDRQILVIICGEGVMADSLRAQAKDLANIKFLPLQKAENLNELLNLADIHVLPQQESASASVMPSKLIGMMASGRPIVASANAGSDIADLVQSCGIIVAPGDSSALASAIQVLARDRQERLRLGENARTLSINLFRQELILEQFERSL